MEFFFSSLFMHNDGNLFWKFFKIYDIPKNKILSHSYNFNKKYVFLLVSSADQWEASFPQCQGGSIGGAGTSLKTVDSPPCPEQPMRAIGQSNPRRLQRRSDQ